jgi:8-oxo-dGTP pyrophosphatase MutT (NUDIX family)
MSTTAVFAEILIVGLEAEAVLALIVLALFPGASLDTGGAKDFAALTTVAALAGAYVLGILADRAADSAFGALERTRAGLWLNRVFGECSLSDDRPASISKMRIRVMKDGGGIAEFLDYQRSRMRVARGTALNLLVGLPFGLVYLARSDHGVWQVVAAAVLGLALLVLSLFASERIRSAWVRRLCEGYAAAGGKVKDKRRHATGQVVAAVSYRRTENGPEFLLVRTKGCRRWTFPKGHVEEDESPAEAVAREAREEAGAEGDVGAEPFTRYLYHGGQPVDAYLLDTTGRRPAQGAEAWRDPRWCRPERAKKLLARRRKHDDAPVADEHARVVDEATRALSLN